MRASAFGQVYDAKPMLAPGVDDTKPMVHVRSRPPDVYNAKPMPAWS
jgi:hypothetical protein